MGSVREFCKQTVGSCLKKHAEALVKDVGIENACTITGKSKAEILCKVMYLKLIIKQTLLNEKEYLRN